MTEFKAYYVGMIVGLMIGWCFGVYCHKEWVVEVEKANVEFTQEGR